MGGGVCAKGGEGFWSWHFKITPCKTSVCDECLYTFSTEVEQHKIACILHTDRHTDGQTSWFQCTTDNNGLCGGMKKIDYCHLARTGQADLGRYFLQKQKTSFVSGHGWKYSAKYKITNHVYVYMSIRILDTNMRHVQSSSCQSKGLNPSPYDKITSFTQFVDHELNSSLLMIRFFFETVEKNFG